MPDDLALAMAPKNLGTATLPFGRNLSAIMKERHLTLKQVAELAGGVRTSVVQNWIGESNPHDLRAVQKLCKSLGIPFTKLVLGEEPDSQSIDIDANFTETELFDGLCKVSIKKLTPKRSK